MSAYKEIQETLFDYFDKISDRVLVEFIDSFVYDRVNPSEETSKLIEKFLKDNGLEQAFINYQHDLNNPEAFFRRSSWSQIDMMNNVRNGLLSLAFNRFRLNFI